MKEPSKLFLLGWFALCTNHVMIKGQNALSRGVSRKLSIDGCHSTKIEERKRGCFYFGNSISCSANQFGRKDGWCGFAGRRHICYETVCAKCKNTHYPVGKTQCAKCNNPDKCVSATCTTAYNSVCKQCKPGSYKDSNNMCQDCKLSPIHGCPINFTECTNGNASTCKCRAPNCKKPNSCLSEGNCQECEGNYDGVVCEYKLLKSDGDNFSHAINANKRDKSSMDGFDDDEYPLYAIKLTNNLEKTKIQNLLEKESSLKCDSVWFFNANIQNELYVLQKDGTVTKGTEFHSITCSIHQTKCKYDNSINPKRKFEKKETQLPVTVFDEDNVNTFVCPILFSFFPSIFYPTGKFVIESNLPFIVPSETAELEGKCQYKGESNRSLEGAVEVCGHAISVKGEQTKTLEKSCYQCSPTLSTSCPYLHDFENKKLTDHFRNQEGCTTETINHAYSLSYASNRTTIEDDVSVFRNILGYSLSFNAKLELAFFKNTMESLNEISKSCTQRPCEEVDIYELGGSFAVEINAAAGFQLAVPFKGFNLIAINVGASLSGGGKVELAHEFDKGLRGCLSINLGPILIAGSIQILWFKVSVTVIEGHIDVYIGSCFGKDGIFNLEPKLKLFPQLRTGRNLYSVNEDRRILTENGWKPILGTGSHQFDYISSTRFNTIWAKSRNKILRRTCDNCLESHKDIYYRRMNKNEKLNQFHLLEIIKGYFNAGENLSRNIFGIDFNLYSTYEDALNDTNRWQYCDVADDTQIVGFPSNCSPSNEIAVTDQWNLIGGLSNLAFGKPVSVLPPKTNDNSVNHIRDGIKTMHEELLEFYAFTGKSSVTINLKEDSKISYMLVYCTDVDYSFTLRVIDAQNNLTYETTYTRTSTYSWPERIELPSEGHFVEIVNNLAQDLTLVEVEIFGVFTKYSQEDNISVSYYTGSWDKLPDFNLLEPYKVKGYQTLEAKSTTAGNFWDAGRANYFGLVAKGNLKFPVAGTYTFWLDSDDGSQLLLDGKIIVDNDGIHPMTERSGTLNIESNGEVKYFVVKFFEKGGGAGLIVNWKPPNGEKTTIPASVWVKTNGQQDVVFYVEEGETSCILYDIDRMEQKRDNNEILSDKDLIGCEDIVEDDISWNSEDTTCANENYECGFITTQSGTLDCGSCDENTYCGPTHGISGTKCQCTPGVEVCKRSDDNKGQIGYCGEDANGDQVFTIKETCDGSCNYDSQGQPSCAKTCGTVKTNIFSDQPLLHESEMSDTSPSDIVHANDEFVKFLTSENKPVTCWFSFYKKKKDYRFGNGESIDTCQQDCMNDEKCVGIEFVPNRSDGDSNCALWLNGACFSEDSPGQFICPDTSTETYVRSEAICKHMLPCLTIVDASNIEIQIEDACDAKDCWFDKFQYIACENMNDCVDSYCHDMGNSPFRVCVDMLSGEPLQRNISKTKKSKGVKKSNKKKKPKMTRRH